MSTLVESFVLQRIFRGGHGIDVLRFPAETPGGKGGQFAPKGESAKRIARRVKLAREMIGYSEPRRGREPPKLDLGQRREALRMLRAEAGDLRREIARSHRAGQEERRREAADWIEQSSRAIEAYRSWFDEWSGIVAATRDSFEGDASGDPEGFARWYHDHPMVKAAWSDLRARLRAAGVASPEYEEIFGYSPDHPRFQAVLAGEVARVPGWFPVKPLQAEERGWLGLRPWWWRPSPWERDGWKPREPVRDEESGEVLEPGLDEETAIRRWVLFGRRDRAPESTMPSSPRPLTPTEQARVAIAAALAVDRGQFRTELYRVSGVPRMSKARRAGDNLLRLYLQEELASARGPEGVRRAVERAYERTVRQIGSWGLAHAARREVAHGSEDPELRARAQALEALAGDWERIASSADTHEHRRKMREEATRLRDFLVERLEKAMRRAPRMGWESQRRMIAKAVEQELARAGEGPAADLYRDAVRRALADFTEDPQAIGPLLRRARQEAQAAVAGDAQQRRAIGKEIRRIHQLVVARADRASRRERIDDRLVGRSATVPGSEFPRSQMPGAPRASSVARLGQAPREHARLERNQSRARELLDALDRVVRRLQVGGITAEERVRLMARRRAIEDRLARLGELPTRRQRPT